MPTLVGSLNVAPHPYAHEQGTADVTITNCTWFNVTLTLSGGLFSRTSLLRPSESITGRGLGGLQVAYLDGRGWSTRFLRSGRRYELVERGGLIVLEPVW